MGVIVAVFTDGGCIESNPSPFGITWAWRAVDAYDITVTEDSGYIVSPVGRRLTNNMAEQVAVVKALEAMPDGWTGDVCSDSEIALGRFFYGWRCNGLPANVIKRTESVKARLGVLTRVHVKGHPTKAMLAAGVLPDGRITSRHNVAVDRLCGLQAEKYWQELELEKTG